MYLCISVICYCFSVTLFHGANNYKSLNYEIPMRKNLEPPNAKEKNIWTHEIPTSKVLWPQKIHEKKFWTPEIPISKILNPRIAYFWALLKFWTQEIPSRKKFRTNEKPTKAQWHDGTRTTRPAMVREPPFFADLRKTYAFLSNSNWNNFLHSKMLRPLRLEQFCMSQPLGVFLINHETSDMTDSYLGFCQTCITEIFP